MVTAIADRGGSVASPLSWSVGERTDGNRRTRAARTGRKFYVEAMLLADGRMPPLPRSAIWSSSRRRRCADRLACESLKTTTRLMHSSPGCSIAAQMFAGDPGAGPNKRGGRAPVARLGHLRRLDARSAGSFLQAKGCSSGSRRSRQGGTYARVTPVQTLLAQLEARL